MNTTATTAAPTTGLVADAKALGRQALTTLRGAVDATLTKTKSAVPQLDGDTAKWAEDWIGKNITGTAGTFLRGAVGLATTELPALDAAAVAGLVEAQHLIDARLVAFGAQ